MTDTPTGVAPVVLMHRYRHRVDVCAVLANRAVGWIARDVLEAAGADLGEFGSEPGHEPPLVLAVHGRARTWTLAQAHAFLAGTVQGASLAVWMTDTERQIAAMGYGNVVRFATEGSPADTRHWSIVTAAALLNNDPGIVLDGGTTRQQLVDLLTIHAWIARDGDQWAPTAAAIDAHLVAVIPHRLPDDRIWPQVVLTIAGLTELHRLLGGTDSSVLPRQEQHQ